MPAVIAFFALQIVLLIKAAAAGTHYRSPFTLRILRGSGAAPHSHRPGRQYRT